MANNWTLQSDRRLPNVQLQHDLPPHHLYLQEHLMAQPAGARPRDWKLKVWKLCDLRRLSDELYPIRPSYCWGV